MSQPWRYLCLLAGGQLGPPETLLDNHGNVMSRAMKVFITFDPATPNLGNYPKETIKNMDKMLLKDLQPSFF